MKFRIPNYYKEFHCIADKCKDSCCSAGWEIDIDSQTENYYKNVPGEFGDKLRNNISKTSPCHFVLDKNNNCPFLNDKKLCDIYTKLGGEHLCQICKDHPRFYEWFDGVKEAGIGLCCEEAARIILSQTEPFAVVEEDIEEDANISDCYNSDEDYNVELYDYIKHAREKTINYLNNSAISTGSKLKNILWYCYTLQQDIDNDLLDDEDIFDVNSNTQSSILPIINYLTTLEPNNSNWPEYLKKCAKYSVEYINKEAQFELSNPELDNYLKNVSIYFIWRYFLKGVFDNEVLSKIKLMYVSICTIKYLLFCKWNESGNLTLEDYIEIVKKYSEEIEYSEDNLIKFSNDIYENNFFDIEYLLGLL